ncbi:MAG TPA: isopropylmalate synthase [Candidatus Altiarchaeales archaeon]|nr:isopropylmalate synthase [Candidatus Altiarchaeales archaeon]
MYRTYEDMPKIELPFKQEIKISDSTIRDGVQMPGIVMLKKHKLAIYEYLHRIGIEKLECFLYNDRDRVVAREMLDIGYEIPEVTAWARANKNDIDLVLGMGDINETGILMSVSDAHIFDKIGFKSREDAIDRYLDVMDYAVDHGLRVRCHLEDITRSDFDGLVLPFVKEIISRDKNSIIRVCDTLGLSVPLYDVNLPYSIPKIVSALNEVGVRNIETHIHDDYGLGVANSLIAFWYGANWSNLTFLGIGERAGNSELEKVILFLINRVKGFEKYNSRVFVEFAEYMEREVRIFIPRNKAIVGKQVFAHESGIHTSAVIKNPFLYEPFPPELVGAKRKLMIGDSSGTDVIRKKVEEIAENLMGVKVKVEKKDPRILAIYRDIHKLYDEEGRRSCISDDEMKKYVEKYFMFEPVIDEVKLEDNESNGE